MAARGHKTRRDRQSAPETPEAMRERVLGAFWHWLVKNEPPDRGHRAPTLDDILDVVHTACELKASMLDEPNPADWSPVVTRKVIGEVFPAKTVGVTAQYAATITPAMLLYVDFLVDTGRWKSKNDVHRSRQALLDLADELPSRFADPSRETMASRLFGLALEEGIDLTDPRRSARSWSASTTCRASGANASPTVPTYRRSRHRPRRRGKRGGCARGSASDHPWPIGVAALRGGNCPGKSASSHRGGGGAAGHGVHPAHPGNGGMGRVRSSNHPDRGDAPVRHRRMDAPRRPSRQGREQTAIDVGDSGRRPTVGDRSEPKCLKRRRRRFGPARQPPSSMPTPQSPRSNSAAGSSMFCWTVMSRSQLPEGLQPAVLSITVPLLTLLCRPQGQDIGYLRAIDAKRSAGNDFVERVAASMCSAILLELRALDHWGLVTDFDGTPRIPPALRPAVAAVINGPGAPLSVEQAKSSVPLVRGR